MRLKPLELPSLPGLYCRTVKLSERLEFTERYNDAANKNLLSPITFHLFVSSEDGTPAKTVDEWDDWCGDNYDDVDPLTQEIMMHLGTVEAAKKK